MNIESSHKFTRYGDTASGCIEAVNFTEFQVGVIGATRIMTKQRIIIILIHFSPQKYMVQILLV